MAGGPIQERNQDATVYVGGLDEKVSESVLWELFLQAGPVVNVHVPRDRITQSHQGYGFVEFMSEDDADYAIKIMNMIKLYGKPVRVNKAASNMKSLDIGANLFIGNLDAEIDEKMLYDIFSAFGVILQAPKIMRDPDTGNSKGFAFVNYASFDASDAAIDSMDGQYLCNRQITVSYAFKRETKGERHGTWEERYLAKQNPLLQTDRPHQLFADAPPKPPTATMQVPTPFHSIPSNVPTTPSPLFPPVANPLVIPSLFQGGHAPPHLAPGIPLQPQPFNRPQIQSAQPSALIPNGMMFARPPPGRPMMLPFGRQPGPPSHHHLIMQQPPGLPRGGLLATPPGVPNMRLPPPSGPPPAPSGVPCPNPPPVGIPRTPPPPIGGPLPGSHPPSGIPLPHPPGTHPPPGGIQPPPPSNQGF